MDILRDAVNAVQRNWLALVLYMGFMFLTSVGATAANEWMDPPKDNPYADPQLVAYEVLLNLFLVFAAALAQSVAFSRLAKDIDRPLWKTSGDFEAIKKYLPLWAALNAVVILINVLTAWALRMFPSSAGSNLLLLLMIVAVVLYIPVGAALMFMRTADWTHVVEAIRPLLRRYPKTLVLLAFTGLLFFLNLELAVLTKDQVWLRPLVDVAFAYFDCVIFSAAWLIIMFDRQTPEEVNLDF